MADNELSKDYIRELFLESVEQGHNPEDYWWIQPIKILDYSNTCELDNLLSDKVMEISIWDDFFRKFCVEIFEKHFNKDLEPNANRWDLPGIDDKPIEKFEWTLTENYFTFENIEEVIKDFEVRSKDVDKKLLVVFKKIIFLLKRMIKYAKEYDYPYICVMGP